MCMGPPVAYRLRHFDLWVYPHVYGATVVPPSIAILHKGLSPCVWGHRWMKPRESWKKGSIPMCMGPPTLERREGPSYWVYPHVYGATSMNFWHVM